MSDFKEITDESAFNGANWILIFSDDHAYSHKAGQH